jgi:polar amino acid transport system substrate-binding protein
MLALLSPLHRKGRLTMKLHRTFLAAIASLAALAVTAAVPANAQTLDQIKKRGVLIVGSKVDYKPFGFRDPSGKIIGLEPDLAADVAKKLGVKLELVPVVASNRMQFLEQGKIDLMIATMSDTPERAKIVGIVHPDYYASGVNVMSNKKAHLTKWEDLKGKKICGIQGAWYNKFVAETYGADVIAFTGTTETQTALMQGNCIGWVYDNTAFAGLLLEPKWSGFEMSLPTIKEVPWGLAVRLDDLNGPWGKFMSNMVTDWHRNGTIIALETKWHIPHSAYVDKMHEEYLKKK